MDGTYPKTSPEHKNLQFRLPLWPHPAIEDAHYVQLRPGDGEDGKRPIGPWKRRRLKLADVNCNRERFCLRICPVSIISQ